MFKKFLFEIGKYKLVIVLLLIIVFLIVIKFNSNQKKETIVEQPIATTNADDINSTESQTENFRSDVENSNKVMEDEVELTPTKVIELDNEEAIIPTIDINQQGSLNINDYAFPYEGDTFLAEKYDNGIVYAKSKIDDKERVERNLKYWYFLEIGMTLPSDKIVWE